MRSWSALHTCWCRLRGCGRKGLPCRPSCCRTRRRSCCPCCSCGLSACKRWAPRTSHPRSLPTRSWTSFQRPWCARRFPLRSPRQERRSPAERGRSERAPGSAGAQTVAGLLVACPEDCKAIVLACPGLAPFVVEALRVLAERCARLPACSHGLQLLGVRGNCVLLAARLQASCRTAARAAHASSYCRPAFAEAPAL